METRKSRSYTYTSRWEPVHQLVWRLHDIERLEVTEIVDETGLDNATVWSIINDHLDERRQYTEDWHTRRAMQAASFKSRRGYPRQ